MMRLAWVSFAPLERQGDRVTSRVASVRYRLLIPAAALEAEGCESKLTAIAPGANRRTLLERFRGADAVVLGKALSEEAAQQALELAAGLRKAGTVVLADYSDDHLSHPVLGAAYRALANAVDRVVASTAALAEVLARHTAVPISVVTDPVEGSRGEPRVPAGPPYRLLWFGHPVNLDTLPYGLAQLRGLPTSLTVVTAPGAGAEQLGARFRVWTTQAVFEELQGCDAVLIPSNAHDPRKAVKSPNRFTESLWAGRFVLAHPLPAYQELADFGWVGEDLGEGVRWLSANPQEALQRLRRGQAALAERFSPAVVGAAWRAAILAARRPA